NLAAYAPDHVIDTQPWHAELFEKLTGEQTVRIRVLWGQLVERLLIDAGGVNDHQPVRRCRDRETAPGADASPRDPREWVVPASVDDEQDELCAGARQALHHPAKLDRFVRQILRAAHVDVDGQQEVRATHLHAVASEEQDRDAAARHPVDQRVQGLVHAAAIKVRARENLEADGTEFDTDRAGVAYGPVKPAHVLIGVVADHERDALLRHAGQDVDVARLGRGRDVANGDGSDYEHGSQQEPRPENQSTPAQRVRPPHAPRGPPFSRGPRARPPKAHNALPYIRFLSHHANCYRLGRSRARRRSPTE